MITIFIQSNCVIKTKKLLLTLFAETDEDDFLMETNEPILIDQRRLDFIVRDLKLTKEGAQKLGAHLKQNNLLHSSTKFAFYRNREI